MTEPAAGPPERPGDGTGDSRPGSNQPGGQESRDAQPSSNGQPGHDQSRSNQAATMVRSGGRPGASARMSRC